MKRPAWLSACLLLTACAHYAPAPPQMTGYVASFDARRLDDRSRGAVWTGADLLSAALARNPQVIEARAKYLATAAAVRVARQPPGATLTLTGEYATERPTWGYTAAADIPLDRGVPRATRITTAQLQSLQAFYDYGEAVWAARTALEKARIDLLFAQREIGLAQAAAALRTQRLERWQRRVAAGEDDRFQALLAQTEAATALRRLADAEGRRDNAQLALAAALGVSSAAVASVKLAPEPPIPSIPDLAAWRRDAALSRRDVLRAVADYDLAENALRAEVAKQYPQISLGPAFNYDHGVNKLPFSLTLVLPPYDLNRSGIAQAEAARAAAGRSLETVQAGVLSAVDTAAVNYAAARDALAQVQKRDLAIARRTAQATTRSLQAGAADRVEELGARAAEAEAGLAVLAGERATAAAAADLEDALRRPFDPAQAVVLDKAMTSSGAKG